MCKSSQVKFDCWSSVDSVESNQEDNSFDEVNYDLYRDKPNSKNLLQKNKNRDQLSKFNAKKREK